MVRVTLGNLSRTSVSRLGKSHSHQHPDLFHADAVLNSDLRVSLRGAAIGNGWIDAKTQYPSYLDYAVKHGIVEANSEASPATLHTPYVSEKVVQDWKRGKDITDKCVADIATFTDVVPVHTDICESVMLKVVEHKKKE